MTEESRYCHHCDNWHVGPHREGMITDPVREQFLAWWNRNWPYLAPTHQALHAYLEGWQTGYQKGISETANFIAPE